MNETNTNTATGPALAFYHANSKGTGCAVKMMLHPAHDMIDGSIMMHLANQKTIGRMANPPVFPSFDFENKIVVKLDFSDICLMLQVFRGECENINEGKGIYHVSTARSVIISLSHIVDPFSGYVLEVIQDKKTNGETTSAKIVFSPAEALGICEAFASSLYLIAFGVPKLMND